MINSVPHLKQLLRQLQQVPYLASKNLYRVVDHLLGSDPRMVANLCDALTKARDQIIRFSDFFIWIERSKPCSFCTSSKRDQSVVCVVQSWQDALSIETSESYRGLYHVLCGLVSPLDGVGPQDLTVQHLVRRVEKGKIKEIILALNQTPEGEATSIYVVGQLKKSGVMVSALSRGVPAGGSIAFMDRLTIYQALSDRRSLSGNL